MAARLLALSQTYGLASREMSLVAVVTRPGDRPGELPETRVVPVGMAQDTAFGAYFGGQTLAGVDRTSFMAASPVRWLRRPRRALRVRLVKPDHVGAAFARPLQEAVLQPKGGRRYPRARPARRTTAEDILLDLASRMDSDGGMPGKNPESRAIATVIALLAFLSQGHTPTGGAFRSHVARLVSFLKSLTGLSSHQRRLSPQSSNWPAKARRRPASGLHSPTLPAITGRKWKEAC